jgi:hypothetical protein
MLIPIEELTEEQARAWVGELYGDGGTWEMVIDSTMCGMRARIVGPECRAEYVGISCAGNETRQRLGAIREAVQELVTQMGLREECIELCDAPAPAPQVLAPTPGDLRPTARHPLPQVRRLPLARLLAPAPHDPRGVGDRRKGRRGGG